jgi:predicted amidohydrolase YtcJ
MDGQRDALLFNGNILTLDGAPPANAVLFHNGRIARVGDSQTLFEEASAGTERIDLAGRTAVPGFSDAHAHIWKIGHLLTSLLDLRRTASIPDLVDAVRVRDRRLPEGQWLLGRGFNEIAMAEKRKPTRRDLDQASAHRPVALTRTCGHICVVNSAAMRLAGIEAHTPAPAGGVIERDEQGEPNGILHETAIGLVNRVIPPPSASGYEEMVTAALKHQLSLGITASSDCGVTPELLAVYRDMDRQGALPARILVMPLRKVDGRAEPVPLPGKHCSEMLRVDTVKFLADGGLSGATAALSIPYRHANTKGTLRFEPEELRRLCEESHNAGWKIATHAIGDVAIDLILEIYEGLAGRPNGVRHRIEHFGLPSVEQLRRAARLAVISVPQTIFIHALGGNFLEMVPDALLPRTYPIRNMLDAGLTVALSSDAPVVEDDNPITGMYAAILRRTKDGRTVAADQGITAQEALYGYTMAGAIASGESQLRGSLTAGKWADVAVLSANPLEVNPEMLPELRVEMTFLAGKKVWEA